MTREIKDNPFAFPFQSRDSSGGLDSPNDGMDLRDYFATRAMQSIIIKCDPGRDREIIVKWAYDFADKMLKERKVEIV